MDVRLISHTEYPLETLFIIWEQSRTNSQIYSSPGGLRKAISGEQSRPVALSIAHMLGHPDPESLRTYYWKTVSILLTEAIPVTENISLTYLLSGIPISLREQIVRHRIGSRVGDMQGVDMIPDLAQSTFWAQSMRMLNMGAFADEGAFYTPESIANNKTKDWSEYDGYIHHPLSNPTFQRAMDNAARSYRQLIGMGIPEEDARQVLPLATTHRLTWTLNLKSLSHIIGKRSCWVSQLGMWKPIIEGMVSELIDKIHPIFRILINPPCIHGDKFTQCPYQLMNQERIQGKDPFPPCSLYLHYHKDQAIETSKLIDQPKWKVSNPPNGEEDADLFTDPAEYDRFYNMKTQFAELWHRDPDDGRPIQ